MSSIRLQYSRTIVLIKKLKPLKKPLFQKRQWSCDFPPRKTPVAQKAPRDFPPRKDGILYPRRVVLGLPSPSPSRRVFADRRTDGRTDGHVTITSQPKSLGPIGYQICLAMELRSWALPAGSATKRSLNISYDKNFCICIYLQICHTHSPVYIYVIYTHSVVVRSS